MAVLIACFFIGAALLAVVGYLRTARRDSRSVEHYKATLGHLQHVAEQGRTFETPGRPVPPHVRLLPRDASATRSRLDPVPGSGPEAPPKSEPPNIVFVDDEPDLPAARVTQDPLLVEPGRTAVWISAVVGAVARLAARPADAVRARRGTALGPEPADPERPRSIRLPGWTVKVAAGAAGAVALALGLTFALGSDHHAISPPHRAATSQTVPPVTHATTPVTTAPAPAVLATSSGPDAAVYTVHSSPVSVALTATNRCWVELRSGSPTGPLVFQGVLAPGDQRTFTNLTGLWLRLGYPSGVTIQIDRTTITIPPSSSPFDITVLLAGSAPTA